MKVLKAVAETFLLMCNTFLVVGTGNLVLMVMHKVGCLDWLVQFLGEIQ